MEGEGWAKVGVCRLSVMHRGGCLLRSRSIADRTLSGEYGVCSLQLYS